MGNPEPSRTTLTERLSDLTASGSQPAGLVDVIQSLATAVCRISLAVDEAALAGARGETATTNVHGETQKPLDLISNGIVIAELDRCASVAALGSEEMPDISPVTAAAADAPYLVAFDPLDGSSNLDTNVGVGTIFSVLSRPRPHAGPLVEDFLQPGTEQVAAGFALYGPSTVLILTFGAGVQCFTLDRSSGEFVLTSAQMQVPSTSREYAINASNARFWEPPVQRYIQECIEGRGGPRGQDFNTRWVASLVAEAYRILTRGGVFLYPQDTKDPGRSGRLRSVYECSPIAFIIEQAGGRASTGRGRTMTRLPAELHERAPFIFGSRDEVDLIERYHRAHDLTPEVTRAFDASLFNRRSLFRAG